jgi:hypothetical protein
MGQSFSSISGTGDGAPFVSPFLPISGAGDRAPFDSPFLPFLVQGKEHRLSVLFFHFWYRGWSTDGQSVLLFLVQGIEH